jgi:hypothetical protein
VPPRHLALAIVCQSSNETERTRAATFLAKVSDGSQHGWGWGWNPSLAGRKQLFGIGVVLGDEEDARGLVRQLTNAEPAIRQASAEALVRYCRRQKFVLDELRRVPLDDHEEVRLAVQQAIAAFEGEAVSGR